MQYRTLGRTQLRVSAVGFGTWAIGGTRGGEGYGPTDDRVSCGAVLRALDLGCTFFDTADLYGHGHSERLLGIALAHAGARERVVVCTKAGFHWEAGPGVRDFTAPFLAARLRASLTRLRTDHVDVFLLHNPTLEQIRRGEGFEGLARVKHTGLARAVGVSIHAPEEGLAALEVFPDLDVIEVVYNFVSQDARAALFPAAAARSVAIVAREPLSNGFLAGLHRPGARFPAGDIRAHWHPEFVTRLHATARWLERHAVAGPVRTPAQAALRFVLDDPHVSVVIPGIKTPAQAEEDLAAADLPPLVLPELTAPGGHA
jgi:aryl-alcohol dehydrogenase-like predicted oxidoreductase